MKIDVKTLEKLVWIIYKRFFIEKGKLKDIQIKIDQYIQIRMVLVYKGIETKIHIDARPYVNEDIIENNKKLLLQRNGVDGDINILLSDSNGDLLTDSENYYLTSN